MALPARPTSPSDTDWDRALANAHLYDETSLRVELTQAQAQGATPDLARTWQAIIKVDAAHAVPVLLSLGWDIEKEMGQSTLNYASPLQMALKSGAVGVLRALLTHGVSPNMCLYQRTLQGPDMVRPVHPLWLAMNSGHERRVEATKILLDAGASPYAGVGLGSGRSASPVMTCAVKNPAFLSLFLDKASSHPAPENWATEALPEVWDALLDQSATPSLVCQSIRMLAERGHGLDLAQRKTWLARACMSRDVPVNEPLFEGRTLFGFVEHHFGHTWRLDHQAEGLPAPLFEMLPHVDNPVGHLAALASANNLSLDIRHGMTGQPLWVPLWQAECATMGQRSGARHQESQLVEAYDTLLAHGFDPMVQTWDKRTLITEMLLYIGAASHPVDKQKAHLRALAFSSFDWSTPYEGQAIGTFMLSRRASCNTFLSPSERDAFPSRIAAAKLARILPSPSTIASRPRM